jgi:aspartate aminotransferase
MAAELIKISAAAAGRAVAPTIWVSAPTWANHIPLLGGAGLQIKEYPYYSAATQSVDFDAMLETLKQVPAGDLVLLHGCCHNPCGTDLSREQWQAVAGLAQDNGFVPFVDLAYQGFGEGLEEDAYGLRLLADAVPEMLVASSCSKNFGLYRERAGALSVLGSSAMQTNNAFTQMQSVARGMWSMPPAHGAALVAEVLGNSSLCQQWQGEVVDMRERIASLRVALSVALGDAGDFSFIPRQNGMFSFLGLSALQVARLKTEFSVYMVDSSRINIAGVSRSNLDYLAASIKAVL